MKSSDEMWGTGSTRRAGRRRTAVAIRRDAGAKNDVRTRALCALRDGLILTSPGIAVDEQGYTASFADNLVPSVEIADFEADLAQGSGDELAGKFRAAHSSSALAVNCFAPFKRNLSVVPESGSSGRPGTDRRLR